MDIFSHKEIINYQLPVVHPLNAAIKLLIGSDHRYGQNIYTKILIEKIYIWIKFLIFIF